MRFAYVTAGDLWLREGEHLRQLTQGGGVSAPRFSADGRYLAFQREGQLEIIGLDGSGPWALDGGADATWSPTENSLALTTERGVALVQIPPRGGRVEPQLLAPGWSDPAWSPDGRYLAVGQAEQGSARFTGLGRLGVIPKAGGKVRLLMAHPFTQEDECAAGPAKPLAWSADRRWLLFTRPGQWASLGTDCKLLGLVSTRGGLGHRLATTPRPSWSRWAPTGATLALVDGPGRDAYANKRLSLRSPPWQRPAITLTPPGYADRDPAWHPSGRLLAFTRSQGGLPPSMDLPAQGQAIYQFDRERSDQTVVAGSEGGFAPFYGGDGLLYWFTAEGGAVTLWVGAATGPQRVVTGLDLPYSYYGQWGVPAVFDYWPRS